MDAIEKFLDCFKTVSSHYSLNSRKTTGCFAYMFSDEDEKKIFFALSGSRYHYNGCLLGKPKDKGPQKLIDAIVDMGKDNDRSMVYCPLNDNAVAPKYKLVENQLLNPDFGLDFVTLKQLFTNAGINSKLNCVYYLYNCCERMLICGATDSFDDFQFNYSCTIYVKYKPCGSDCRDCQAVLNSCAGVKVKYLFEDSSDYRNSLEHNIKLHFKDY